MKTELVPKKEKLCSILELLYKKTIITNYPSLTTYLPRRPIDDQAVRSDCTC